MAGGMILMGILLAMMPLPVAMMLHGITQLASNAWRAFLWRTQVDWRGFRGHALGALAALPGFVAGELGGGKPLALPRVGATPFITPALSEKTPLHLRPPARPPS